MAVLDSQGLLGELSSQLNATNRYWVETKNQAFHFEGPLTSERLKGLRQNYSARLLIFGSVASGSAQLQLMDLGMGDIQGPLNLQGSQAAIAKALIKYLIGAFPLTGQISAVHSNAMLLDLGGQQGVKPGMVFWARRSQNRLSPPLARVEITSVDDWVSSARIKEIAKGQSLQIGDYLTEEPADFLLR
jgi:hypothetical protein